MSGLLLVCWWQPRDGVCRMLSGGKGVAWSCAFSCARAAVMTCTGFGCSHVIVLAETMVTGAECSYSVEIVIPVLVTIDYGT